LSEVKDGKEEKQKYFHVTPKSQGQIILNAKYYEYTTRYNYYITWGCATNTHTRT